MKIHNDKSQIGKMTGEGVLPSQIATGIWGFFFCQLLKD